jgi:hypothetical protein
MAEVNYIKIGAKTQARELMSDISELADKLYGKPIVPTIQEVIELRKLIDELLEAVEVYNKT